MLATIKILFLTLKKQIIKKIEDNINGENNISDRINNNNLLNNDSSVSENEKNNTKSLIKTKRKNLILFGIY